MENMRSRFVLIEVIDRSISASSFATFDEAYDELRRVYSDILDRRGTGHIGADYAWINSGPNDRTYDWKIVEIRADSG